MKKIFFILTIVFLALNNYIYADTYVVAVGISKYQNIKGLILPEKDAITVANLYKTRTKSVITITGRYATRANIIKAMTDQFKRAKKGDMVVFFFSGHGYDGGFCPYDIGKQKQNALTYSDMYATFRKSKATSKVIIADACMSGGLRKEKKSTSSTSQKHPSDVVMFLSSRTKEYSIESRKMTNGFFTTYLLKGLRGGADTNRDRVITAKEIYTYVSDNVRNISQERQHPVMWGNFSDNFIMMDWRD